MQVQGEQTLSLCCTSEDFSIFFAGTQGDKICEVSDNLIKTWVEAKFRNIKIVHIRRTRESNWGHLHFRTKEEATRFYDLIKDHLPITGPYGKKITFKRGRKSIYNGNVGDNDSSSSTFPISGDLTSSLSPTSEDYDDSASSVENSWNKSGGNGSVTSSRDDHNNNTQNKVVTKLIRYSGNIPSEIYEVDTNDRELQECITKIVSKTLKRKSNDQIIIEETPKKLPSNVKMWSPDHVKKFLESRMNNSDFNEIDVKKIRNKELTGRAFLRLTEEKLTRKDGLYELNPSPAEGIMELVEELVKDKIVEVETPPNLEKNKKTKLDYILNM
ncbi:unnamed protein product [Rhizophagus irregularis]|nr:unnamed protein product [Rhizophagus irregularis]